MNQQSIKIDIISDIACPWCYIGKHRLEAAIKEWKDTDIVVDWHPFLLNPNIPKEGQDRETYLINKFGTADRPDAMGRIHDAGKQVGITFNFGKKWLGVNTLPLHQLMYVAGQEGFKTELKEKLFYAYFTENLHLNKPEVLNKIMDKFGWDEAKTQRVLNDKDILEKVKKEIALYQQRGVTGVPFFIINDTYGISGAQPPETFLNSFRQILNENFLSADGDSCGIDGDCPA